MEKKARPEAVRLELRKIYHAAGSSPPNMNAAWNLIHAQMPHAPRSRVRDVLREQEFARLRRKAGRLKKHSNSSDGRAEGNSAPDAVP